MKEHNQSHKSIKEIDSPLANIVRTAFDEYVADVDNDEKEVELLSSLYIVSKRYPLRIYDPLFKLYQQIKNMYEGK